MQTLQKSKQKKSIVSRWGGHEELAKAWTPISRYFLANYHRLRPHEGANGLNNTEAMLLVHLMDFKWDKESPHPAVGTLAKRMGVTRRRARSVIKNLEGLGLLERKNRGKGTTNAYKLDGFFKALGELYESDQSEEV